MGHEKYQISIERDARMVPVGSIAGESYRTARKQGTVLLYPSPCFRIEEVLISLLTFAGVGKTVIAAFDYKYIKNELKGHLICYPQVAHQSLLWLVFVVFAIFILLKPGFL